MGYTNPSVDRLILARPWHLDAVTAATEAVKTPTSWMQVAKTGDFVSSRYGKFSITKTDLAKMLDNFQHITPKKPTELPVDYDHKSMDPKYVGDGIAAGWIKDLELREDGDQLWALVAWTPDAATKIEKKEYRFVSPSFVKDYVYKDGKPIGPTLLAAAITNHPFLEGMAALTLCDGVTHIELNALIPAGQIVDIATPEYLIMLMQAGQKVTIKPGMEHQPSEMGLTYEVGEVVGAGDDAFVTLKAPDGSLHQWFRATELAPAMLNQNPQQQQQKQPQGSQQPAAQQQGAQPQQQQQPAQGDPSQPQQQKPAAPAGAAKPGGGSGGDAAQAAHAAAASAHAHAAGAHAAILQKGMSMSQTFKLSHDGKEIELTAEQLEKAGIKLLTADEATAATTKQTALEAEVKNLSTQVKDLIEANKTATKTSAQIELSSTLTRLITGGFITKPIHDWAQKTYKDATDLTAFREWAALQTTPVIKLETEHGSSLGADGVRHPDDESASDELLKLANQMVKDEGISLRQALVKVGEQRKDLAQQYREQFDVELVAAD